MLQAAKISITKTKRDIFLFGIVNCIFYIIFLLAFKFLGLLHIWGLRMTDFVILSFVSLYQVHRRIKRSGGYIPFLQVFCTILFTGAWSFILFAAFIFCYSFFDPYLAGMFVTNSNDTNKLMPCIIINFEGGGGSLIVALIASLYASRYEDGEAEV